MITDKELFIGLIQLFSKKWGIGKKWSKAYTIIFYCPADNFAHRTAVRQALAQDKDWIDKHFSKILPMLVSQVCEN